MSTGLITVEQAARRLAVHPKTVLRYIREGRLPAARIGKAYRILGTDLDAFAGIGQDRIKPQPRLRTTCVTDLFDVTAEDAERLTTFLQSAAIARDLGAWPLNFQTIYDPDLKILKVVVVGCPDDVTRQLDLLHARLTDHF